ncbi:hypothetical protein [Silvibacterium dinghuense]|uniref:Uncharacterized protein n=1 Tax=Silvibacterium dinghuense TaxID=1560006 RepID=A0A4Q1SC12_9BACT|nr:hypothetical protein [Silvibacterium dinghuense]RXS94370.1 hypothetical protein ESZ00_14925 [Silvibacterium dinghuense]
MNLMKLPSKIEAAVPEVVSEFPWSRAVAAGSLVASAWLLIAGKRKAALAVAAAGAAAAVIESPETVREIWEKTPGYLRAGQDFLVRAEGFVEDLAKKGEKLRETLMR